MPRSGGRFGVVGRTISVPGCASASSRVLILARRCRALFRLTVVISAAVSKRSFTPGPSRALCDWMKGSRVDWISKPWIRRKAFRHSSNRFAGDLLALGLGERPSDLVQHLPQRLICARLGMEEEILGEDQPLYSAVDARAFEQHLANFPE